MADGTPTERVPASKSFDAIVIGAGIGGMAFAAIMAKLCRWRVLVLERHFKIGGFTQPLVVQAVGPGTQVSITLATWDLGWMAGACSISSPKVEWRGRPCGV